MRKQQVVSEKGGGNLYSGDGRKFRRAASLKFVVTLLAGTAFFLVPVSFQGKMTVPFDIVITSIRREFPQFASLYTLVLVAAGCLLSLLAHRRGSRFAQLESIREFETSAPILVLRCLGLALAAGFLLNLVPEALQRENIGSLMWNTLAVSVALIIPIGAMVVQLFIVYGGMEFLGVLAQPVMQPLFRLPGRAALDALTSWAGSYSVGLYITKSVYQQGDYTRQHVFILATCFSTVSMGFVGVVAATLNLLHRFPLILGLYLLSVVVLAAILVRLPPIRNVAQTYCDGTPAAREDEMGYCGSLWHRAWQAGLARAQAAPPVLLALKNGFLDGLRLAAGILGTILAVGTFALILAKFTPIFTYLGRPLAPLLEWLRVPDAAQVAPAVVIEITEMYLPALLVTGASEAARLFIAVLSVSQLIFFSSLGPMIIDMFRDIPIRPGHLLLLFLLRTVMLLPFLALCLWFL